MDKARPTATSRSAFTHQPAVITYHHRRQEQSTYTHHHHQQPPKRLCMPTGNVKYIHVSNQTPCCHGDRSRRNIMSHASEPTSCVAHATVGSASRQVFSQCSLQDAWTISPATNGAAEACAGPEACCGSATPDREAANPFSAASSVRGAQGHIFNAGSGERREIKKLCLELVSMLEGRGAGCVHELRRLTAG
jgi:hypothetical protein